MEGGKMKKVKKKGMESRKSGGWSKDLSHTVNETGGTGAGKVPAHPEPSHSGSWPPLITGLLSAPGLTLPGGHRA